jgi:hypothetical protein
VQRVSKRSRPSNGFAAHGRHYSIITLLVIGHRLRKRRKETQGRPGADSNAR